MNMHSGKRGSHRLGLHALAGPVMACFACMGAGVHGEPRDPVGMAYPVGAVTHVWHAGGAIYSSPAIARDGTIYVAANDGKLYAFNPDGTTNRTWLMPGGQPGKSSPAIGPDGSIYVGTTAGQLYSFHPAGGTSRVYTVGNVAESSPAVSRDGTIYVHADTYLYALTPAGATSHVWQLGDMAGSWSSPAIAPDGTIYVGCDDMSLRTFYGLNPDGTTAHVWKANSYIRASPTIGPDGSIYVGAFSSTLFDFHPAGTTNHAWVTSSGFDSSAALAPNGQVLAGNKAGTLFSFATNGSTNWSVWPDPEPIISSPAVTESNICYYASTAAVYAVNEFGSVLKSWNLGNPIQSSPAVAPDGTVYMGALDGSFYALAGVGGALANSAWPKFRQNLENTGGGLLTPQHLAASKGMTGLVALTWSGVPYAQGYEIWCGTSSVPALANLTGASGTTSYQHTAVSPETIYYYWVRATNAYVASPLSAPADGYAAAVQPAPPHPPTNVKASKGLYPNKVRVTWSASAGVMRYEVWRHRTDQSGKASKISDPDPTAPLYDDTGAVPGQTYYYWVKAVNAAGASSFSAPDSGFVGQVGPLITANGLIGNVYVNHGTPLSIAIQVMNINPYAGTPVDWWAVAFAQPDGWFYLNGALQWTPFDGELASCRPAYQGALFNLPSAPVLDRVVLPRGAYDFWFAVDYPMDGILNLGGPILLDQVTVIIR